MTSLKYLIEQENNLLRKLEWVDSEICEREKQRRAILDIGISCDAQNRDLAKKDSEINKLYEDRRNLLIGVTTTRAELKGYIKGLLGMIDYE